MNEMVPIDDCDADASCPACGADPGQQCSDADGTEWAGRVHLARQWFVSTLACDEVEQDLALRMPRGRIMRFLGRIRNIRGSDIE